MFLDEDAGSEYAKGLDHNGIQVALPKPSLPPEIESIINEMQAKWLKMQPPTLDPAIETILAELQTAWQTNQAETTKTIAQTWSEVDAEWETMLNQVETENMWFEFDVKERLAELKTPEFEWSIDDLAPKFDSIDERPGNWDTGEFPALELGFAGERPTDNHTPTPWAYDTPLPTTPPAPLAGFDPLDLLEIKVEEPITEADNDTSDGMLDTVNSAELLRGTGKQAPGVDSIEEGLDVQFNINTGEFPALDLADERPTDNDTPNPRTYDTPLPQSAPGPIPALFAEFDNNDQDALIFEAGEFPSGNTPVRYRTSGTFTGLSPDLSAYYQLAAERLGEKPAKLKMTNSAPTPLSKPPTIGDRLLASRAKEGAKTLWGKVRSWF